MSDDEVAIRRVPIVTGVLAAEAGKDEACGREALVGRDRSLAPGVSSVDEVEAFVGRAAVVVLLRRPGTVEPGDYGVATQAHRELSSSASPP